MEKVRVLLAEDHAVVRESISRFLDLQKDISVVGQARDGEEAVELAEQLQPDVVVMDISMPKLNGIEATRKIKANNPTIMMLILTAYDYDQYIFSLLDAGACGYLLKEVSSQELVEAIRAVHRGESVLHPAVAHKVLERFKQMSSKSRPPALLTQREISILQSAAKGMSNKDIAEMLGLSVRTVEAHITTILNKLGVGSRTEAVIRALKDGWLVLDDVS